MSSKSPVRACDDVDETALSYAEIKALCAGDPRIREKMDLDIEVAKLRLMKADYQSNQFKLEDQILKQYPEEIRQAQEWAKGYRADMALLEAHPLPKDGFVGMAIKGKRIADKEAAGKMLLEACRLSPHDMELGEYRGMKMTVDYDSYRQEVKLVLRGEMSHTVTMGTDVYGNLTRIENALANMPQKLEKAEERIAELERQTKQAKAELGKPFAQEKALEAKAARRKKEGADGEATDEGCVEGVSGAGRRSESGRKRRNKRMEPMKNIPVYRHSAAYAVEHGELEAYKTSRVAGVACRDAIEKAVAKHYRDNCLNKAGAREVIDEFGKERVMTVLAITIRDKLYDGRFSSANKAWAQAFPIEPDIDSWGGNRNLTLVVRQTHPGLLNLFCDQAKAYESEKVSVREKLKAAAKNAPVPSTKNEMER